MKKLIALSVLLFFNLHFISGQNQGINNLWLMGYSSWGGPPYGGTNIDFLSGAPVINYVSRPMDMSRTHANISDSSGNILFYTNGYYIADATDDTMQNGSNISPSSISTVDPYGLAVPQACLIIPKPGSSNLYYMFHSTLDNAPTYNIAFLLYYSVIDMNLNGGIGGVLLKNQILISDSLNAGKITACRHANGVDWWVVCHRFNSNIYYKFLVSPSGISAVTTQSIGSVRSTWDIGQVAFSPDGNKFAYFNAYYTMPATLDVYDFDRCSGTFTNASIITIPESTSIGGGLAFSPSSQYLYISNIDSIYQYDLTNANIASTKLIVAVWDSFYSPNPPFATLFDLTQLAPDGRIYIGTGNSTFRMHVINNPDSLGLACNVQQHNIIIPAFYFGGIPNHPNYFWDAIQQGDVHAGGINEIEKNNISARASPNPSNGIFTLQFPVQKNPGILEIFDVIGNIVQKNTVAQWSQYKQLDISLLPYGIYLCRIKWNNGAAGQVKIIKE